MITDPITPNIGGKDYPIYRGSLFRFWNAHGVPQQKYKFFDVKELTDLNLYRGVFAEVVGTYLFYFIHVGINASLRGVADVTWYTSIGNALCYWFL